MMSSTFKALHQCMAANGGNYETDLHWRTSNLLKSATRENFSRSSLLSV